MKSIYVACKCHHCGYQTHKQSETLIISDFEPHLIEDLKSGSYYRTTCPCCKEIITFFHPCIFLDKQHQLILYMKSEKDRKVEDHQVFSNYAYRKRYVANIEEIQEQIRIAEDELDDRVIQILKVKIEKQKGKAFQAIQYHDYDRTSNTLWFQIKEEQTLHNIAVLKLAHDSILASIEPEQTTMYEEVNIQWVYKKYR